MNAKIKNTTWVNRQVRRVSSMAVYNEPLRPNIVWEVTNFGVMTTGIPANLSAFHWVSFRYKSENLCVATGYKYAPNSWVSVEFVEPELITRSIWQRVIPTEPILGAQIIEPRMYHFPTNDPVTVRLVTDIIPEFALKWDRERKGFYELIGLKLFKLAVFNLVIANCEFPTATIFGAADDYAYALVHPDSYWYPADYNSTPQPHPTGGGWAIKTSDFQAAYDGFAEKRIKPDVVKIS